MKQSHWLKKFIASEDTLATWLLRLGQVTAFVVVAVLAIGLLPHLFDFLAWLFSNKNSPQYELDAQKFGTFGDFVSGLLNPVLTFATFAALLLTVLLQQRELTLARTEFQRTASALEQENFEATFFRLSSLIRETVDSIDIEERKGVQAFRFFHGHVATLYRNDRMHTHNNPTASYNEAYETYGYTLGHYFRVVYNSLRYLQSKKLNARSSEPSDIGDRPSIDVEMYARLLRAQLSDYELVVLFYNSIAARGRRLAPLLEEFEILDNMPQKYLLIPNDRNLIGPKAWGPGA